MCDDGEIAGEVGDASRIAAADPMLKSRSGPVLCQSDVKRP
jgi:hypothetical protein